MPYPLTVPPLRLALAALRRAQPALPPREDAAVAHAARLRLTAPERRTEAAIDVLRRRLAASEATVPIVDHGAGSRGTNAPVRPVATVYRWAATRPAWGRFLFGLARALRPRRVLELGTNLGVGAAHLAGALALTEAEGGPAGRLVTLEGAPALAALAAENLRALGHAVGGGPADRARIVVGAFADTLPAVAPEAGPSAAPTARFDLVFIDGHHEADAALTYLAMVEPHLAPGALVILDDVEPGQPVRAAWRRLRAERPDVPALYAGRYGLLFPNASAPRGAAAAVARETGPLSTDPAAVHADA